MNDWTHWDEGRESESCREVTGRVLWDFAEFLAACAALGMLTKSMGLF